MLSLSDCGERRLKPGRVKADQIRRTGARIVATLCHNCGDQLLEISKHYQLGIEVQAAVELVYQVLVWPPAGEA